MKGLLLRRKKLGLGSCKGIRDASKTGLDFIRNDQVLLDTFKDIDMVFRWGCTSTVPVKNVVNTAKAIHTVSDKSGFRKMCMHDNTILDNTPLTVFNTIEAALVLEKSPDLQLFVRPRHHSQGKNYHVVSNGLELLKAIQICGEGWYASELINKSAEYRVFVVQGRVVWVANKIPDNPDAIVWNVAQGGKFENVKWGDWPMEALRAAVKAVELAGLDFGGVDLMLDQDGHPYLIEINSAPSQTSPYRQSCTAKAFDYIVENGKDNLSLNMDYDEDNWRHYIHPAIWPKKE